MQSIERYGVVALLFLVVTVIAVLVWDGEVSGNAPSSVRAADTTTVNRPAGVPMTESARDDEGPLVRLRLKPTPRPITRDLVAAAVPGDEPEPAPAGLRPARAAAGALEMPDETAAAPERRAEVLPRDVPSAVFAASNQPVEPGRGGSYRVRAGDTLSEIAQAELGTYVRWREIVELNPGLDPNRLMAGQEIRLPSGGVGGAAAAPAPAQPRRTAEPPRPRSRGGPTYRVLSGDSLWKIAARRLGDGKRWREIAAVNPGLDPDHLAVGAEIALPGGPIVASNAGTRRQGRVR